MKFDCTNDGQMMHCLITADRDMAEPVFCCSGMVPMKVVKGGTRIGELGSFTEVQLPDLVEGEPYELTLAYTERTPANRAWLPLGPYLRTAEGSVALPPVRSGCDPQPLRSVPAFEGLQLVPQPTGWTPNGGSVQIAGFASDDDALIAVAELAKRRALPAFFVDGGHAITVKTDPDLPIDAYTIEISTSGVVLTANSYGGRFYGGITLLTLLQTHKNDLPCGVIQDSPRFEWRGQHLDCARHFFHVATILDLLDLMALMKLNRYHWHFADDEAFRLQIDSYPELWQRTELCGEGHLMPTLFSRAIEAGGSYSKPDVAQIIDHAKNLNIEVMPEIEALSHALAIGMVFPEMLDPDDTGTEESVQGYRRNILNPAMPKTWEVLSAVAKEVGDMFPFGHLHLGCDELPDGTWMNSPAARKLMDREDLKNTQDLQGWTMSNLAEIVTQNGQVPAGWEEAAQGSNGGIGHGAILFSWTGKEPGFAAARAGYKVVMTPAQHIYLDMAHTDDIDDWGANWAAYVSLDDTVDWDPVPQDEPELASNIIGVQGAFWGEFTTEDSQMWPMLLPRIYGVACQAWQSQQISSNTLQALAASYDTFSLTFGNPNSNLDER
ncbi:MAG: beta-N-acetylhexosaminidase [Marinosulfonomonas sp.]